ncbi:MAG TPA: bacillithiol biosynthesis cysteine-adding enzyme BshC, partial [Gemmatimonadaceae bacterium]|nr:bacillithiol biosynthesis cysteine-adding enzyme BshC [Gemmatimonadaceae bacterium]
MNPRVISQALTSNPLATAAISGTARPDWYEPIPHDAAAWGERIDSVRQHSPRDWLSRLAPGFEATGKAKARLEAAGEGRGVVVTTGQQPGLFGGPLYTLTKALSALTLADALQEASGVPVAPVFWAATDDTDFKEASATAVAVPGGAQLLRIDHVGALGPPMSAMPLGDISVQLEALRKAAGSAVDLRPLELLEQNYREGTTVGNAFVGFLRALFEPLGIAVIDASHHATRTAAKSLLTSALASAGEIAERVAERNREVEEAGFAVQVQDVPGLSLVFSTSSGARRRVPIKAAAKQTVTEDMGPNVLLRPIVERAILPTATYIGGPAEIAYFAQISPIADTLGVPRPSIVPRWSCTVIEPHVEKILEKLYLLPEDLRDQHEAESRIARERLPKEILEELDATRGLLEERVDALTEAVTAGQPLLAPAVTGGLRANLIRRLDRFERRLVGASKRRHADLMQEIGTARGSLYPFGKPQERALNFVPLLARYGETLRDEMLDGARDHAAAIV